MFAPVLLGLALLGCAPEPVATEPPVVAHPDARRVLVVINKRSPDSIAVGNYYVKKRGIPPENIAVIDCGTDDQVPQPEFQDQILAPIKSKVDGLDRTIDYIVLTKGIPLRFEDPNFYGVDAWIAAMDTRIREIRDTKPATIQGSINPYFAKDERFSSKKFGIYLVTRLDGYTQDDAKALVDRAIAAKPERGLFFFDQATNRTSGGFERANDSLALANNLLRGKSFEAELDSGEVFRAPTQPLMGYASWGSNDGKFDRKAYAALKFHPGALAETFVSTSARTFRPTQGGQSLIADLIKQGVTGVKGYASEPYVFAMARPEILFDRYTKGYNLAESMYMASPIAKWKDVVIGDPLCQPYPRASQ